MNNSTSFQMKKSMEAMLNDCSIDAIIAVDLNKKIIAWNATAEKIYGKAKHEVIGKCILDIIPSIQKDEESLRAIETAAKGIKSFVPASKIYYHRMHAENHFIPLKNDGEIKGVMNLVHDVAHRIKAEEKLQHLNEQLEKGYRQLKVTSDELASFTYITSNKIKEPIRQIYTGIEHLIVTEASKLSNSGKASFRRIQSSINRMDLLLNDILSLSQISIIDTPQTLVDMNEIVDTAIASMKNKIEENNASITIGEFCSIKGHKNQLITLLIQLMDNAIKFNNNARPAVNIECKETTVNKSADGERKHNYYCLNVKDNGIGIEENNTEKIFLMFEKLNGNDYKGSGVGLALVNKIMEVHNGFVSVESDDKGSIFQCFFPKLN